jgi:hypothetical protein
MSLYEVHPIGHSDQVQPATGKLQRCMALVADAMEILQTRYRTVEVCHAMILGSYAR